MFKTEAGEDTIDKMWWVWQPTHHLFDSESACSWYIDGANGYKSVKQTYLLILLGYLAQLDQFNENDWYQLSKYGIFCMIFTIFFITSTQFLAINGKMILNVLKYTLF